MDLVFANVYFFIVNYELIFAFYFTKLLFLGLQNSCKLFLFFLNGFEFHLFIIFEQFSKGASRVIDTNFSTPIPLDTTSSTRCWAQSHYYQLLSG